MIFFKNKFSSTSSQNSETSKNFPNLKLLNTSSNGDK